MDDALGDLLLLYFSFVTIDKQHSYLTTNKECQESLYQLMVM